MSKTISVARGILENGELLEATEAIAYHQRNRYEFARRAAREISLVVAGQCLGRLGMDAPMRRMYSHSGFYGLAGMGRGDMFTWAINSDVFPSPIRFESRDTLTEACLIGTVTDGGFIVPPPLVTSDVLFIEEYATLVGGRASQELAAHIRKVQEDGRFTRQLAKAVNLQAILQRQNTKSRNLKQQLGHWKTQGLEIDDQTGKITVTSNTSWIISSARFGSSLGRPLLSLGDVSRYRWIANIPSEEERRDITATVGCFPPVDPCPYNVSDVNMAWSILVRSLKDKVHGTLQIPKTQVEYDKRSEYWREMLDLVENEYGEDLEEPALTQLINLRYASEFHRVAYQHAALMQFKRDPDYDTSQTDFQLDYEEDYGFARDMFVKEYVPSLIDVVQDILSEKWKSLHGRKTDPEDLALKVFQKWGEPEMSSGEFETELMNIDGSITTRQAAHKRLTKLAELGDFLEYERNPKGGRKGGTVRLVGRGLEEYNMRTT